MCIRDRVEIVRHDHQEIEVAIRSVVIARRGAEQVDPLRVCLLYTSDAADERSSVDLGGRRIIKKKTIQQQVSFSTYSKTIECEW